MTSIITRVFNYLGNGGWSTEEVEVGGGGSQPTDTIIEFEETAGAGPLLPIVAVDDSADTFTVEGDWTRFFLPGFSFTVTGSTGNDADYPVTTAAYDSGDDETTITTSDDVPDGTVDGDIQAWSLYEYEFEIAANSAIEWVFAVTTEDWSGEFAYLWVGDQDDISAFSNGNNVTSSGSRQWPLTTLAVGILAGDPLDGEVERYTLYPDGATIKVLLQTEGTGSSGRTTVVVHHHITDDAVQAVKATFA